MNSSLSATRIAMSQPMFTYFGRLIKPGERNKKLVEAVQNRLNELGCGPIGTKGDFGSQPVDIILHPDAALPLLNKVLLIADAQVGIEENTTGI